MLRVSGPLVCVAALPPWSTAPSVVLTPEDRPGCPGVVPYVKVCGCSLCFGRYTPCGPGSGYARAVWCLWLGAWLGRCVRAL